MRRAVTAVLLVAGVMVGVRSAPPPAAASTAPPRLLVTGREYSLVLSRATIAPGRAIVQFKNSGEDLHDLVVKRIGGDRTFGVGVTSPGEVAQFDVPLKAGSRYALFCSISNHRLRGMRAQLQVKD